MATKKKSGIAIVEYNVESSTMLKVTLFAQAVQSNNGSVSTKTSMLLLSTIEYEGVNKEIKTEKVQAFFIKGIHGMVRHRAIQLFLNYGIEVCNTTSRIESMKGLSLQYEGTHPLSACLKESHKELKKKTDISQYNNIKERCFVHKVFGAIGQQYASLIKYEVAPVLGNGIKETAKIPFPYQEKAISRMNNRHNRSLNGLISQDFSQRYIGNEITFYIDVSKLNPRQLGMLILTCERLREFGGGINAGYGMVYPLEIDLIQRIDGYERISKENGGYKLEYKPEETILDNELYDQAVNDFKDWLEVNSKLSVVAK